MRFAKVNVHHLFQRANITAVIEFGTPTRCEELTNAENTRQSCKVTVVSRADFDQKRFVKDGLLHIEVELDME